MVIVIHIRAYFGGHKPQSIFDLFGYISAIIFVFEAMCAWMTSIGTTVIQVNIDDGRACNQGSRVQRNVLQEQRHLCCIQIL
jgi:hypothetical protein